jgi:hypothetical protein
MSRLAAEADERWSFVQKKANKQGMWIAMDAKTRQIIAFHVGDRSGESGKALWATAVTSWSAFWPGEEKPGELWTVDRLTDHIAELRTMEGIAGALLSGISATQWINMAHGVICKAGRFEAFREKPVIPNQRRDLMVLSNQWC